MTSKSGPLGWEKKLLAGIAAVAVLGGGVGLAVWQPWKKPPPVSAQRIAAELELAAGEVTLEAGEGQASAQRLLSATPLPAGAKLRTSEGARALIRLSDGARVYLDENTFVEIAGKLILHEGRAWLDAPPLERGQEAVQHQVGNASVALSEGGASLEIDGDAIGIYVAEGLAVVASDAGRSEVAAGERATIASGSAPEIEAVAFWEDWTGGMGDRGSLGRSGSVGAGSLYAVDRQAEPGSPALPLQIQNQSVRVVMKDQLAETLVDQRFFNPSGREVEGYYWFTVPENSQLVGFALETNGQLIEGEIVERKEASAKYEAAVERRTNDPALLEWVDDRTVRARIFPVPSLGTRRIVVRYQQLLTEAESKLRYSYPLAGPPGKDAPSIEEFSLQVDLGELAAGYDIATLGEARVEEGGRRVTMRRSGYTPRSDFQLELTRRPGTTPEPLRLSVLDPGGDQARFVMVRYSPEVDFDQVAVPAGEVVVVVDTSAAGDPAEYQTRLAVAEALLRSLSAGDKFAVMSADVRSDVLHPDSGLAEAGPEAVSQALEKLATHSTGGATDLGAIFEQALDRVHGLEQPAIVYIGDGLATSGERGADQLTERLRRSMAGSRARLFTVGVGQDVDEHLLTSLARVGGGHSLQVDLPEQAVVRALELSGALKTPTITDLALDLGEGLDDVFISTTGKLSRGQELVLLARTHHDLPKEVTIEGRLGGEDFERTHELKRDTGILSQVTPRFWAGAYIERLLGDSRGPEAVRGKILSLGLEYGIMTPYTSYLALDSEQAYARMGVQRRQRRFGGVKLTAMAPRNDESSAAEGLIGVLSAPMGCSMSDSSDADEKTAPASTPAPPRGEAKADPVTLNTRGAAGKVQAGEGDYRSDDNAAARAPASRANAQTEVADAAKTAEEVPPPVAAAEPEPAIDEPRDPGLGRGRGVGGVQFGAVNGDGGQAGGGSGKNVHEIPTPSPKKSAPARHKGKRQTKTGSSTRKQEASGRLGTLAGDEEERKELEKTVDRGGRWGRRVVSPVARARRLPCSDASSRGLAHRRLLWEKRLQRLITMTDALEVFEAAAGSCEVPNWKDQRTFLHLLHTRAETEADIELLLAHFREDMDAVRYLARGLMRRVIDPARVAAVENALFGAEVDWEDVDRQVLLELDPDKKIDLVRAALTRSPGDPRGEKRLIELLVATGQRQEAVARGRRLREQGVMTPGLAQSLGQIMVAYGQAEEARRLFSEIVEFDPDNAASRRLLGDIFLRHGWYDAAYRQYADLRLLAPDDALATIRLGRAAAAAGRVDEALRTLRKVAAGEGRPGADDPRRFARLHAAAYLAQLLATDDGSTPRASMTREMRRLQLFDGPGTWVLLVWEDLQADLTLAHEDPKSAAHVGDLLSAADTGLLALQAPASGVPPLIVRHAGEVPNREVKYRRYRVRFDGNEFVVVSESGTIPAGTARLMAAATPRSGREE